MPTEAWLRRLERRFVRVFRFRYVSRSGRVGTLLLATLISFQVGADPAVRFFAVGDVPYSAAESAMLEALLADAMGQRPAFLVHAGDVKSGNAPCTRRGLGHMAAMFKEQGVPILYTPGDNEWTDCHRAGAGGYEPLERLSVLRLLYYGDPAVLRLHELEVSRRDDSYPENYWFIRDGVAFATVHVVGSHNNQDSADPAAASEVAARSDANRRNLRAAVEAANAADAAAFVLLFHANPWLENQTPRRGFDRLHDDLKSLLREFAGPVLAIHGDTHRYRFDHPLKDAETGRALQRFTRLEVPGSPSVAGVWVSVDPGATEPFSVGLTYTDAVEHLVE